MGEVKQNEKKPIVRAIDVGYGFTKFTLDDGAQSEPKVSMFPSIALKQSKQNLGAGFLSERDTVEVVHNGIKYEVGAREILQIQKKAFLFGGLCFLTPPAGAEKPERSGGFLVPLAGLVMHFTCPFAFSAHSQFQCRKALV